jgi:hypothetical protein
MIDNNIKTPNQYKDCGCKNCPNKGTKLMQIEYIYKKGWFCDSCAVDISFHGLGKEIIENEQ